MPAKPPDQTLCHVHTACGADLYVKRSQGGSVRYVLRTGETGPDHKFPVIDLDPDTFALILQAERTSQLGFISEALSLADDEAIPAALACIALALDGARDDSTTRSLLDELRQLRATIARLLPAEPTG